MKTIQIFDKLLFDWLKRNELNLANIEGYKLIFSYTRDNFEHGGVCFYAKADFDLKTINQSHNIENFFKFV